MNIPANILTLFPVWSLLFLGFSLAFFITWFTIPSIVTISRLKNLNSAPNKRTSHIAAIPNLGGIAVFIGFVLSTVIFGGSYFRFELKYIFASLLIVFFLGIKDDILIIAPLKKLAGQIFAISLIAILADIRISNLYGFLGIGELPYLASIFLTVFVFIVIINGFNLIDGIDGLASGVGMLTATVFGIWFWRSGSFGYTILSFSFVGTLAAFFYYNVFGRENKIFLGDTGSLLTGFVISVLACRIMQIEILQKGTHLIASTPSVIFGILIIPLFDSLRVFILRIRDGKSPFRADRQHLHHYLLRLGLSHLQATSLLISVNFFFIILSFTFGSLGIIWLMAINLGSACAMSYALVRMVRRRRKIQIQNALELFFAVKTSKDRTLKSDIFKNRNTLGRVYEPKVRVGAFVN